jgi:ubiquinone/menaquinone biosynthesis C-methylase UbiE
VTDHRDRTRAAYDRLAPVWHVTEDNLYNEHLERRAVRQLLAARLAGARVLDAGCADGAQTAWMTARGAGVTGLDLSPAMVEAARRRCGPGPRFVVADLAERLPFGDAAFDGALCSLTLHYLEDIGPPLAELARVLGPSGWLVLSVDHPAGAAGPGDRYFDTRLLSETWSKGGVEVTQHWWRRPLSVLADALADAGFVIERLGEPRPDDEARRRFPAEAATLGDGVSFLVAVAVKDPRRGRPG